MNKELEQLIAIQDIDKKIETQNVLLKNIPLEIDALYSSCNSAKEELQKIKYDIDADIKKRKDMALEVESNKDHLSKSKKKLVDVKNNKEYTALLSEIELVNKTIIKIEDSELELMEIIEEKKKNIPSKETNFNEEEKKFILLKKERGIEFERHKIELLENKKLRKKLTESIDPDLLQQYDVISESYIGTGVVVKVADDICQGCNTAIPPQLSVEIRKGEDIIYCPHCNRILYQKKKKEKEVQEVSHEVQ